MSETSLFRREKTTAAANARHVMTMGAITGLLALLAFPQIERLYERLVMPSPPITAVAEAVRDPETGAVKVKYTRAPVWSFNAKWIAQIRTRSGVVTYTGQAPKAWSYVPSNSGESLWSWGAWWESDYVPVVPKYPFQICIRYEGYGTHGTPFETDYQCGPVFDPTT